MQLPQSPATPNIHQQLKNMSVRLNAGEMPEEKDLERAAKYERLWNESSEYNLNPEHQDTFQKLLDTKPEKIKQEDYTRASEVLGLREAELNNLKSPARFGGAIRRVGGEIKIGANKLQQELYILKLEHTKVSADKNVSDNARARLINDVNSAEEIINRNRGEINRLKKELESATFYKGALEERLKNTELELESLIKLKQEAKEGEQLLKKEDKDILVSKDNSKENKTPDAKERDIVMSHLESLNYGRDGVNVKKDLISIAEKYAKALELSSAEEIEDKIQEIKKASQDLQSKIQGDLEFNKLGNDKKNLIHLVQSFILGDVSLDDENKPKKENRKIVRNKNGILNRLYENKKLKQNKVIPKTKSSLPAVNPSPATTISMLPTESLNSLLKITKIRSEQILRNFIGQFLKENYGITTIISFIKNNPELKGSNFENSWRKFNGILNDSTQKVLLNSLKSALGVEIVEKYEIQKYSEQIERSIKNNLKIDTGNNSEYEYFINLYTSMQKSVEDSLYNDAKQMEENMQRLYALLEKINNIKK